ncbi:hypothetical protein EGM97_03925 [Pseudomonas sp. AF32]|nr:hypothetical protein [Pseudomonas sp. AF32]
MPHVGASLLAIAVQQSAGTLPDTPPSRAGSLPQGLPPNLIESCYLCSRSLAAMATNRWMGPIQIERLIFLTVLLAVGVFFKVTGLALPFSADSLAWGERTSGACYSFFSLTSCVDV